MSLGAYSYGVVAELHRASRYPAVGCGCELTKRRQLRSVWLLGLLADEGVVAAACMQTLLAIGRAEATDAERE